MEWVVKLEARSGWGEVETIEVATIKRRVVGLTAEEAQFRHWVRSDRRLKTRDGSLAARSLS